MKSPLKSRLPKGLLSLCRCPSSLDVEFRTDAQPREFIEPTKLVTCTLLGVIASHSIQRNENRNIVTETLWTAQTKSVAKVNAVGIHAGWISIGGFDRDGKGVAEMWKVDVEDPAATQPSPVN